MPASAAMFPTVLPAPPTTLVSIASVPTNHSMVHVSSALLLALLVATSTLAPPASLLTISIPTQMDNAISADLTVLPATSLTSTSAPLVVLDTLSQLMEPAQPSVPAQLVNSATLLILQTAFNAFLDSISIQPTHNVYSVATLLNASNALLLPQEIQQPSSA